MPTQKTNLSITKELVIFSVGLAFLVLSYFIFPLQTLANVTSDTFYFVSLALSGAVLLSIVHLAGGQWIAPIRPLMEAFFKMLPWLVVPALFVFIDLDAIYPWGHEGWAHHGDHHVSHSKEAYLSPALFAARLAGFFLIWIFMGQKLFSVLRSESSQKRKTVWSVLFIVSFAFTFSLFSVDWLMSITPHWFSTIYPYYCFAALLQLGTAWSLYLIIGGERFGVKFAGDLTKVKQDLAALMFGFSCLWAYMWISQFLLIWYGNLPLEVEYFLVRLTDDWKFWFFLSPIVCWIIPFLIMLRKPWKTSDRMVLFVASLIMVGRWLDAFLLVSPNVYQKDPLVTGVGLWDVLLFVVFAAMAFALVSCGLKIIAKRQQAATV